MSSVRSTSTFLLLLLLLLLRIMMRGNHMLAVGSLGNHMSVVAWSELWRGKSWDSTMSLVRSEMLVGILK